MTKKDYIKFATWLKRCHDEGYAKTPTAITLELAQILAGDNSAFDRARFLKAAGVQD